MLERKIHDENRGEAERNDEQGGALEIGTEPCP